MGEFLKALVGLYVLSLVVQLLEAIARLVWQSLPLILLGFLLALIWKTWSSASSHGMRVLTAVRYHQAQQRDLLQQLMNTPSDSADFEDVCLRWHTHMNASPHLESVSSSGLNIRAHNCCNSERTKFGERTVTRSP